MNTREAAVAGYFYPGIADELRAEVQSFTSAPVSDPNLHAHGIVVPHAGYVYSGYTAGKVFSCVNLPKRVVLLGPNHTGEGADLALAPAGLWRTPLGTAEVSSDMNRELMKLCPELREDAAAHRAEHCLEVQIPFLQVLRPDFTFAAICVGTARYSSLNALGHALSGLVRAAEDPVLMVTSSDMTHYKSAEAAATGDRLAIDRITAVDPEGLYRVVLERDISMCGFAPAVAMLIACADLGAASGRLVHYANSGESTGDYEQVVGYAGLVINA